uniref:Ig-like domain-containing protein n=1 Tax=Heterorhabditis bacteriophora TaxID=37862 RepID=A0A1I7WU57_HETBA
MIAILCALIASSVANLTAKNYMESVWSLNAEIDKTELNQSPELRFIESNMKMNDQMIKPGVSFELKCEAFGIPPPIFTWTLNGKRIAGSEDSTLYEKLHNLGKKTVQNGVTVSKLIIPCADKKHRGKYKCIVTNGHLTEEKSAKITIDLSHLAEASRCKLPTLLPPVITQWSDSRIENEGNAVQLFCRSQPGAEIAWYNENRQLLNTHPEYEVYPNGDLMIKKGSWAKMGTYTCVASNEAGEDRVSTFFYPTGLEDYSNTEGSLFACTYAIRFPCLSYLSSYSRMPTWIPNMFLLVFMFPGCDSRPPIFRPVSHVNVSRLYTAKGEQIIGEAKLVKDKVFDHRDPPEFISVQSIYHMYFVRIMILVSSSRVQCCLPSIYDATSLTGHLKPSTNY